WGSFAQFTKVQAQQLIPKPTNLTWEEAASYGLVYFTAYRMLIDQCDLQAGNRVLIWGAAGGLGVFATQLCKITGAQSVGVVSSQEKGELVERLGATGWIDRGEYAGMMRTGDETPDEEKELIEQGLIRPVLWRTMPFEGVAEAHQLMRENKHLGKIAILVGAKSEGEGKTEEGPGAIHAEVGA